MFLENHFAVTADWTSLRRTSSPSLVFDGSARSNTERRLLGLALRTVITTRISLPSDTVRDFAVVPEKLG